MNDPFSYSNRWDSVGLDCVFCINQNEVEWPNTNRDYACKLHNISLASLIAKNGFKEGEWFCSAFEDNGKANKTAITELTTILTELDPKTLYGAYGENRKLKEISFTKLHKNT